ncbi:SRPBCC domain-containing protein [Chryseolinea sp. H1M3-3]|uniref:SRPBCC family protein n=1 Tax=Chryseolinea sp. H1M3-3 TaxID=3034144 RepID=UPI0023EAB01A|nr:SRPBCC domain-containing protein [Chryseolinea sp. H1M3-3]
MKNVNQTNELIITHQFNAPKKLVFNAFADPQALGEWWGPVERKNSVIKLDFRVGGIFHYRMEDNGKKSYGRFLFKKIQPHDLLEFTNGFADENANIVRAPFDIELPSEILYSLVFTEKNKVTTITMTGRPVEANNKEEETFRSIEGSMRQGFSAMYQVLEDYLRKLQSKNN